MTWLDPSEMGPLEVLLALVSLWALLVAAVAALICVCVPFIGAYLDRRLERDVRRQLGMPPGHPERITRDLSPAEELYLAELDRHLSIDL